MIHIYYTDGINETTTMPKRKPNVSLYSAQKRHFHTKIRIKAQTNNASSSNTTDSKHERVGYIKTNKSGTQTFKRNVSSVSWYLFKEHNTHFIQGETLNRIILQDPEKTPLHDIIQSMSSDITERKKARNRYTIIPVYIKYPMPFMMNISCDTCPGPHRPRSHTCTGNQSNTPRAPLNSFMQRSPYSSHHFFLYSNPFAPPLMFTLEVTASAPRCKVAKGILIPLT